MSKKMIKKALMMVLVSLLLCVTSCDSSLKTPTGLKIEDNKVYWDNANDKLTYRLELTNISTTTSLKRIVTYGADLNTLNIPEGDYVVKIQIINKDKTSEFSESVNYHQVDLLAVNKIEGKDMISEKYIKWIGRTYYDENTASNVIYHSASGFEVYFKGTTATATITATNFADSTHQAYVEVVVDDNWESSKTIIFNAKTKKVVLAENMDDNEHKINFYKRTESIDSHLSLVNLETDGKFIEKVVNKDRFIEVIAASSSTGYGNLGSSAVAKETRNSDALKAYAFLTAQSLNSDLSIYSASGWGMAFSRWTSPQTLNMFDAYKKVDMFSSVDWDMSKRSPDVIVVNLGTNDWSYIAIKPDQVEKDKAMNTFINRYVEFVEYLRSVYPNSKIIILYGLMLESSMYEPTETIFETVSSKVNDVYLLKALGDGAGCNSHPSAGSHIRIAEALTDKIKEITGWN